LPALKEHLETLRAIILHAMESGCVDCPEKLPSLLEFDHICEPEHKLFSISKAIALKVSPDELLDEIRKCQVRCRNCHKRRHCPRLPHYLTDAHIDEALHSRVYDEYGARVLAGAHRSKAMKRASFLEDLRRQNREARMKLTAQPESA
jgi:hypothetical protein